MSSTHIDTPPFKNLHQFTAAIRILQAHDPQMQLQTVICYLMVAQFGPCHLSNIRDTANVSQASVSRNCSALGTIHRRGIPGLGLVETWEDPMNRKSKIVGLTKKGILLKQSLISAISREYI